jgi:hypothetical protein
MKAAAAAAAAAAEIMVELVTSGERNATADALITGVGGGGGGVEEAGWRVRAASRLSTSVGVFCCASREGWEDARRGRTIERETGLDRKA